MNGDIVQLVDPITGDVNYPETKMQAVTDDEGNQLDEVLNEINFDLVDLKSRLNMEKIYDGNISENVPVTFSDISKKTALILLIKNNRVNYQIIIPVAYKDFVNGDNRIEAPTSIISIYSITNTSITAYTASSGTYKCTIFAM